MVKAPFLEPIDLGSILAGGFLEGHDLLGLLHPTGEMTSFSTPFYKRYISIDISISGEEFILCEDPYALTP